MVVLIAVLGSTILGYVDKSKYSKDIQALDSIKTAVSAYVADANSVIPDAAKSADGVKLNVLMNTSNSDKSNIIAPILKETFNGEDFNNSSSVFDEVTTSTVTVWIIDGAVSIEVQTDKGTDKSKYPNYTAGKKPAAASN